MLFEEVYRSLVNRHNSKREVEDQGHVIVRRLRELGDETSERRLQFPIREPDGNTSSGQSIPEPGKS
jgi:hypothetical protein